LGIQGHLTSSISVPPESLLAVLVVISSKSVFICNCSRAKRVSEIGKITILGGTPLLRPRLRIVFYPAGSGTKFGHKKPETLHYHAVKTKSFYLI